MADPRRENWIRAAGKFRGGKHLNTEDRLNLSVLRGGISKLSGRVCALTSCATTLEEITIYLDRSFSRSVRVSRVYLTAATGDTFRTRCFEN